RDKGKAKEINIIRQPQPKPKIVYKNNKNDKDFFGKSPKFNSDWNEIRESWELFFGKQDKRYKETPLSEMKKTLNLIKKLKKDDQYPLNELVIWENKLNLWIEDFIDNDIPKLILNEEEELKELANNQITDDNNDILTNEKEELKKLANNQTTDDDNDILTNEEDDFYIYSEDFNNSQSNSEDETNTSDSEKDNSNNKSIKLLKEHQKNQQEKLKEIRKSNEDYKKVVKKEMLRKIHKNKKNFKLGDFAKIHIPKIDRKSSLSAPFLFVKILKIVKKGVYELGCTVGILDRFFGDKELYSVQCKDFPNLKNIPNIKISLRSAVKQIE
ncbi:7004_t:CDS:2, partial [Gigaspora rosea]